MGEAGCRSEERLRAAWDTHHDRLWRGVLAWSGDREIAADAVAEAFAQAVRRDGAIDDVGRWVWRAAFRIAAGMLATRSRRVTTGSFPVDERPSDDTLPDDVIALLDVLDRLAPEDREIVVLSLVGGWPSADVATMVGSTPGAVRVRLHRAKVRLRGWLEDDHD